MSPAPAPHLFLDRDGTMIVEEHYLRDPAQVALETGVAAGLRRFVAAGYRPVVVSNQSGIGRGLLTEADLTAVNARTAELLTAEGLEIASWHHCPHHPDEACRCRKPGPGMFEAADALSPVDWAKSIMVGDKRADLEAGLALGMASALVLTGYGAKTADWAKAAGYPVVPSLTALADLILGETTRARMH